MRLALIQLPHFYGDGLSRPPECYPLGLGYISNFLADNGIDYTAIDLWGMQYSLEEALNKVDFSGYDFFCISSYVTKCKYLKELSQKLKKLWPRVPIICGGLVRPLATRYSSGTRALMHACFAKASLR